MRKPRRLLSVLVLASVLLTVPAMLGHAAGQPMLMVVANPGMRTAGESVVAQRLTTAGYDVTFADDNGVSSGDAAGKAFVLVAQSTSALNAVNALRNLSVPLWVAKPYLFDDFGMTGPAAEVDYGITSGSTITIAAAGHPMTAGRNGSVAFQTGHSVSWGKPSTSATVVARAGTTTGPATTFVLEPGDPLVGGGTAPACRLTFPLYTNGPTALTADGLAMLDATAGWAASNCTSAPPPPPPPPPASKSALIVVANPAARTSGETFVGQRLTTAGYIVSFVDDDVVSAADAAGKSFVLVAQTSSAVNAVTALRNLAVPLWVAKPYLFDDFGITGSVANVDYGIAAGSSATIVATGHPMAAGRSGVVTFQNGHSVSWGKPPSAATIVARAGISGTAPASIFVLEPGDLLASGGTAPACRLTFPLYTSAPMALTTDGLAMLDATAAWAATNCTGTPPPPPPPGSGIERVIQISVDGLNPQAIIQLGTGGAPTFHWLAANGTSTLNARTVVEITRTLPNHTSMITGRPVTATGGHQVSFNEDNGSTVHAAAGGYVAGIFDVVHDAGLPTALYAGAPKFDFLDRSWNAINGALDVNGPDNGRDKIDVYQRGAGSVTTSALISQLQSSPATFSFLHLAAPDSAGHQCGRWSPRPSLGTRKRP